MDFVQALPEPKRVALIDPHPLRYLAM
jgi:hypothetical protein